MGAQAALSDEVEVIEDYPLEDNLATSSEISQRSSDDHLTTLSEQPLEPPSAFHDFLRFMIPIEAEREMFLNWLTFSLRNEASKPRWSILLYSEKHGTGKSTLAEVLKQLFGPENTSHQNGVGPLVDKFNKPVQAGLSTAA